MNTVDLVGLYTLSHLREVTACLFCSLPFLPLSIRSSGIRGRISVVRARELYRFVPRDLFRGNLAAAFLRTSGPARVHQAESGFSRRSYLHVNDGTAAASWLVIGFRLRAPLRRHLDAHRAGDIDISL